ncbi:MAG: hypothetical protein JW803_08215 [Endomicrobiales bacterium]|nr:hypothetical protein [Endomicrobiales bacterium]
MNKKATIFLTSGLGDNLLALPLLLELEAFADLYVVVNDPAYKRLFEKCLENAKISVYNGSLGSLAAILKDNFKNDYWLYPVGSCSRKTRLLNLISFADKKYGFTSLNSENTWQAEIGLDICLTPNLAKRAWQNNLRLLTLIDEKLPDPGRTWDYYSGILRERMIGKEYKNKEKSLFVHAGSRKYPGKLEELKRWPLEKYINVTRALLGKGLFDSVTYFVGPDDDNIEDYLKNKDAVKRIEVLKASALGEDLLLLAQKIASHSYFLGNDSGVAHLASVLGVPSTVIISGICEPSYVGQSGGRTKLVSFPVECGGCTVGISHEMALKFNCRFDNKCVKMITEDMVKESVLGNRNG